MPFIFSKRLKERRLELGLTQQQLAKAAGVTSATITRYETGDIKSVKLAVIDRLADYMDVDRAWLAGKDVPKERVQEKVYLLEKDKKDVGAILDALLDFMEDHEKSLTWCGKPLDTDTFNVIYNSLIVTQHAADQTITGPIADRRSLQQRIDDIER